MWRKQGEYNAPQLAANDQYSKQVPIARALPLWGGISENGFAVVTWHLDCKKLAKEMWAKAVRSGCLTKAIKEINPKRKGPWTVLCDSESFLRTPISRAAYTQHGVRLWDVPPKSPDLNPVEMFWGWTRKKLRNMDLQDLKLKRPALSKMAYKLRVQSVFKSKRAQNVASAFAKKFRSTCSQVSKRNGAAADN